MTRINKFIAELSGLSRRAADGLINSGKILINGQTVGPGYQVKPTDRVVSTEDSLEFDHSGNDKPKTTLIMLNKPVGYVCSRKGQGSKTVYDILPAQYRTLKPVGRLDKDSSGLLLLTNDGKLANKLTHPRYQKEKVYRVKLDKPLMQTDKNQLVAGVKLEDGVSKFTALTECSNNAYEVVLAEGRNRQIRRTFAALGYKVVQLHRISLGPYKLGSLKSGLYKTV